MVPHEERSQELRELERADKRAAAFMLAPVYISHLFLLSACRIEDILS